MAVGLKSTMAHHQAAGAGRRSDDRLLIRVAGQGGSALGVLGATAVVTAVAELALPLFVGRAFDAVIGDAPEVWLTRLGLLVAVLVTCDVIDDVAVGSVTAQSTRWLRHSVLDHFLALGPRRAQRFDPGDVSARLVANAADAAAVAPVGVFAVANLIPAAGGIAALALIDPWLCLGFLLGVPLFVLLLRVYSRDASAVAGNYLAVQAKIAGRLTDALAGAKTITAAGTVDHEVARVLEPLPELHRHGAAMWRAQLRISTQDAAVVPIMQILVLAVAGYQLANGQISPGEMLAAGQYVVLASGLGAAVGFVGKLARARAGAARVGEVLAEPRMSYGTRRLPAGGGRLEFRDVTVLVGGEKVLCRLNLVVPAGSLAAVVGPSGAGKSLIAALAGRLLDPDDGQVLLDGVPLPELDREELRGAVAYGFERPSLIGETLSSVIGFGHGSADRRHVVAAARAAQAHGFICRMPQGYQTRLDQAPMSGGEIQRLGLARAFARGGRLLVLDDVAASLDTVTEHHISQVLTGSLIDRTRLVVAHRASTAARADAVIWMDRGRLRAVASHPELWQHDGYRAMFAPDSHTSRPDAAEVAGGAA